ncbi:chemotaxis protein CheR [Nostocales cyanobacterium HT-58-2]|nr:chemotaxis protein CheR [Nostocales cyanobacterium HT-58-2]
MSTSDDNSDFEALLDYLKQNCGCNLTGYKHASLMRRLQHRMQQLNIENYRNYLQYLHYHPEEYASLLDTILINYSGFFRDRDSWDYLANQIIPQIITNKQPHERIRVWSAGCACGQEVYTLAMLLVESLGIEQYLQRVQIFATDLDEDALKQARQGSYSEQEIAGISSEFLSKYFEQIEQRYVFHSKLRCPIIFGRHDLTKDAPMSKIDLLVCRNVLIYVQPKTQVSILVRFHFALTKNSFFFLGNSESLINSKQIFTPINLKHRIFAKGQNLTLQDHLLIRPQTRNKKAVDPLTMQTRIWQAAFENSPFAQIAVDRTGRLLVANEQAYALFYLKNGDIGAQVQDLEVGRVVNSWAFMRQLDRDWAKPTAGGNRQPMSRKNIEWATDISTIYLDIYITPISDQSGKLLGANLTFIDVTSYRELEDELKHTNSKLTRVTQELQSTKNVLATTHTELECAQKELDTVHQEIQLIRQDLHHI